jgi:hypothetical protein
VATRVPIACDLGALTTTERERRAALASQLRARVIAIKDRELGYRLNYAADTPLPLLAEWIGLERRCCPFLAFTIELPAAGASIVLHLSGGEGVKEFLTAALGDVRQ